MHRIINILIFLLLFSCRSKETKSCFTYSPQNINAGDTIIFDASCSTGGSYYEWDFGISTNSKIITTHTISNVYNNPGTYAVRLIVKRKDGVNFKKEKISAQPSMVLVVN